MEGVLGPHQVDNDVRLFSCEPFKALGSEGVEG